MKITIAVTYQVSQEVGIADNPPDLEMAIADAADYITAPFWEAIAAQRTHTNKLEADVEWVGTDAYAIDEEGARIEIFSVA